MFLKLAHLANLASLKPAPPPRVYEPPRQWHPVISGFALIFHQQSAFFAACYQHLYLQSYLNNPAYEECFPYVLFWYCSLRSLICPSLPCALTQIGEEMACC